MSANPIPPPEPTAAMYPSGTVPAPAAPPNGLTDKCPHCGSITHIEPSTTLRFVCGVCGKARVPTEGLTLARSGDELDALRRATAARNATFAWGSMAMVSGGFGVLSFMVLAMVLAFASPGFVATAAAIMAAAVPMVIAAFALFRTQQKKKEIAPLLDEGWAIAAKEVVEQMHASEQSIETENLAKALRTTNEHAEKLLAQLSAQGEVRALLDTEGARVQFEPTRVPAKLKGPRVPNRSSASTSENSEADEDAAAEEEASLEAENRAARKEKTK